ncbi:MAG TPA: glycosyltransferase family A protein, partial [Verrucomicrobiae bacterium]|nr:glycosyltransferase family A protein [Verrucomicrobiae bacterium]
MSLFSVVIPTFNRATLLHEALDSIFAQTFTDYEVIVVDDGSSDETLQMLANYGNRIRVFQQKNQGPGAARNLGAQHATGEYLAFLDSDDQWFPWTLEAYHEILLRHQFPSFVVGKPLRFRDEKLLRLASGGQ